MKQNEIEIAAEEWRGLRVALAGRLKELVEARKSTSDVSEIIVLDKRIADIRQQVEALVVEESIAQFLEDTEKYLAASSSLREDLERDPDTEIA